jgi:hypothetical protein
MFRYPTFARLRLSLAVVASLFCTVLTVSAQDPADVLLELVSAEGSTLAITRADLEALPQVEFETGTEWTEGSARYRGPRLIDVLSIANLQDQPVEAIAANDYKVTLTTELVGEHYPIVALRINDQPFGLRERGPLWIIYPYDLVADYRNEKFFTASVWQLVRISHVDE